MWKVVTNRYSWIEERYDIETTKRQSVANVDMKLFPISADEADATRSYEEGSLKLEIEKNDRGSSSAKLLDECDWTEKISVDY